jgi:hypothetical protein
MVAQWMVCPLMVYLPKVCPGTVSLRKVWQPVDPPTDAMTDAMTDATLGDSSKVTGLRRVEHGLHLPLGSFHLRDSRHLGHRPLDLVHRSLHTPTGLSNSSKADKN